MDGDMLYMGGQVGILQPVPITLILEQATSSQMMLRNKTDRRYSTNSRFAVWGRHTISPPCQKRSVNVLIWERAMASGLWILETFILRLESQEQI